MQHAYDEYNERARATGKSRGHFMVDLCSPGHMTACLRNFQEATRCTDDTWESSFGEDLPAASQLRPPPPCSRTHARRHYPWASKVQGKGQLTSLQQPLGSFGVVLCCLICLNRAWQGGPDDGIVAVGAIHASSLSEKPRLTRTHADRALGAQRWSIRCKLYRGRWLSAGDLWTSADMVDCILAYAATVLVDKMTDPKCAEGREMLELVRADARASKQFLLLAHLCARPGLLSHPFHIHTMQRTVQTTIGLFLVDHGDSTEPLLKLSRRGLCTTQCPICEVPCFASLRIFSAVH